MTTLFPDTPPPRARPVAEVVASSTRALVAEVYRDDDAPAFGSWVEVAHPARSITLYGLVSHVEIGPTDPSRRIRAHGLTDDEVRRERPHLPGLVACTLRAVLLAYRDGERVRQTLPPHPAPLHAFVRLASPEAVAALGAPYDFLRTLALNPDPSVPVDELLVAALANIAEAQPSAERRDAALVEAARAVSRLLRDDHERLHSILRRST